MSKRFNNINIFERIEILDDYIIKTAKSEYIEKIIDLIYSTEPNPAYKWGYGSEIEQK